MARLSRLPARVEAVYNGKEAIHRIASSIDNGDRFQLLILDMHVPREASDKVEDDFGLKLLTKFSSEYQALAHDIPIIVYTQFPDIYECVRCMKAGAYDYIPKKDPETKNDNLRRLFDTCHELLFRNERSESEAPR